MLTIAINSHKLKVYYLEKVNTKQSNVSIYKPTELLTLLCSYKPLDINSIDDNVLKHYIDDIFELKSIDIRKQNLYVLTSGTYKTYKLAYSKNCYVYIMVCNY